MNFQGLNRVEDAQLYIGAALRYARETTNDKKEGFRQWEYVDRFKAAELMRLDLITRYLSRPLFSILKSFPSISQLPPFYQEMIKCTIDYVELKQSFGALNWANERFAALHSSYKSKIAKTREVRKVSALKMEFVGRVTSVMKQINPSLKFLEAARRIMKEFPTIKTSMKSACIVGFPNSGKTTLLLKLTGSKPEISSYPFTTKGINVSYIKEDGRKLQLLDTPGTLNRQKSNPIEIQAYLAMRYAADFFVFVFDVSEEYSLKDQLKLYNGVKDFKKEVLIYASKADILPPELITQFTSKMKEKCYTSWIELKAALMERAEMPEVKEVKEE